MILSADEVKVSEEQENKIVVRSDETGPCRYVLNYCERYEGGKE